MLGIDNPVFGYFLFATIKFIGYSLFALKIGWWYVGKPISVKLDAKKCIGEDVACSTCEYNLRGLELAGLCPECGAAVKNSCGDHATIRHPPNPALVGFTRMLIGIVFGIAYWFFAGESGANGTSFMVLFLGLVPLRAIEWTMLIWLFFDRKLRHGRLNCKCVVLGTILSFVLDIPSTLGFILVGGLWIC